MRATLRSARKSLPALDYTRSDSSAQLPRVGPFAQPGLREALAVGVVEQDPPLLAGPDGVGADHARPLDLEEKAAGPAGLGDQRLVQRRLFRVELVVPAQDG